MAGGSANGVRGPSSSDYPTSALWQEIASLGRTIASSRPGVRCRGGFATQRLSPFLSHTSRSAPCVSAEPLRFNDWRLKPAGAPPQRILPLCGSHCQQARSSATRSGQDGVRIGVLGVRCAQRPNSEIPRCQVRGHRTLLKSGEAPGAIGACPAAFASVLRMGHFYDRNPGFASRVALDRLQAWCDPIWPPLE